VIRARRAFIALAIAIAAAACAAAADKDAPLVKTSLGRHRILIGDRIRYSIDIISRLDLEIEMPKFKDDKIGECEIKDSGAAVKRPLFGAKDYMRWLDITSYYIGKRSVPPIEIKYREKGDSAWKTLKTPEQSFTVESVLPRGVKLTDIKDIKGPLYPFSLLKLLAWIAAALVSAWAFLRLLKRLRKKAPPKLPHELALEALEAARAEFAKTGDMKQYYVNVSDAVRHYIETVFKLRAPEMTTQEFLAGIGFSRKISDVYKGLLKTFMEACDLVKFAKHAPSKPEVEEVFTTAKKFIEETQGEYPGVPV
jgi:hypothetical protein